MKSSKSDWVKNHVVKSWKKDAQITSLPVWSGGSNAIGAFSQWLMKKSNWLVEAADFGLDIRQARSHYMTRVVSELSTVWELMQSLRKMEASASYSISAGLDYPGLAQNAYFKDSNT